MKTLRDKISTALSNNNETWKDVVATTLSQADLNECFHWASSLPSFTVWTANNVYHVEHCADDGTYITSVDRHPPANPLFCEEYAT